VDIISRGEGTLFQPVDPFGFREERRAFNRGQRSKLTTVKEAVATYVKDGCYLASGGFGSNRIATALIHEIVRQKKKDLSFAGHTTTHDYEILVAGDCIRRVDGAYIVGLEARGLSTCARKAHQAGKIEVCEWSNASLAWRFTAGARGIPFFPCYVNAGTDTYKYSAACTVECPFTGKPVVLVPALNPDVAVIHVHKACEMGNCEIKGTAVADEDVAAASKHVIITCEELVPTDYFREDPARTTIPWIHVDAVIEVPGGSYPGNMPGHYFSDEEHLSAWLKAEKDPEAFADFLDTYIYSCNDFADYLEKCGGQERLNELYRQETGADHE
jgi:glutaconate CoA-transferase subunit A